MDDEQRQVFYTPASPLQRPRLLLRAMAGDLLRARSLTWRLIVRDVKARYRQTALGYVWAVLPPIVAAALFLYLRAMHGSEGEVAGVPAPLYVFVGAALWQTFAESVLGPIASLDASRSLLGKVDLPREAVVLSGLGTAAINSLLRLLMIALALLLWPTPLEPAAFLFPVGLLALGGLGFTISMLLAPLSLLFRDVHHSLASLLVMGMFLTPVGFPPPRTGWAAWLDALNPVSPLLVSARAWLLGTAEAELTGFLTVVVIAAAACFCGWIALRVTMASVIERLPG